MNYTEEQIQEALRVAEAIMRGRPWRTYPQGLWITDSETGPYFDNLLHGRVELKPEPRMAQLWQHKSDSNLITVGFAGTKLPTDDWKPVGKPFPWPEDV